MPFRQRYRIEYSPHVEGDSLYVSETLRRCVMCRSKPVHELSMFKQNSQGNISTICENCLRIVRRSENQNIESDAVGELATAVVAAVGGQRRTGHGYGDTLTTVSGPSGGRDKMFTDVGKVMKKTLRRGLLKKATSGDLDRSLKASVELLKAAAIEERTRKPTVSLDEMPEDEIREGLLSAAREMAIADQDFRRMLVNDPEVRKLLLKDLGVDMLEARATNAAQS